MIASAGVELAPQQAARKKQAAQDAKDAKVIARQALQDQKLNDEIAKAQAIADDAATHAARIAAEKKFQAEMSMLANARMGVTDSTTQFASLNPGSANGGGGGGINFGYKALVASAFVDDLQYGSAAIINQVPMAVAAFGGSAGLAAVIGIAAVGLNVFGSRLGEVGKKLNVVRDPLRDAGNSIEGLTEKVEAMNSKPLRLQADFRAIESLEKQLKSEKSAWDEWQNR